MTDADLISTLRTRLAYHETEAERCRRMLAIAEDDGPVRAGRKPAKAKGSGEQRRPPSGGKRLKPQDHPKYADAKRLSEGGMKLPQVAAEVGLPLTTLRNWRNRCEWK